MNMRKAIIPILMAGFVIGLFGPAFAARQQAQDKQAPAKQQPARVIIPKEVKDVLQQNLATRQSRPDFPFSVVKSFNLPGRDGAYIYLFLKMKNADLGFAPNPQAADKVKAVFDVFLQFHKVENGQPTQIIREIYCPTTLEEPAAAYDPNKEEIYSVGVGLLPGNYLVALALSTHDLKKIGAQYFDFTLPNPQSFTKELDTTPVIFLEDYQENKPVEVIPALHKDFLRYAVLQITPNYDNAIKVGETLDTFFYIFGAQPNEQGQYTIECLFEVNKGQQPAIKFAPQTYQTPFISQPLPMKQTLITKKTDDKGVVTESQTVQDLTAGTYTFSVKITDKLSGRVCTKSVDFTVKEAAAK